MYTWNTLITLFYSSTAGSEDWLLTLLHDLQLCTYLILRYCYLWWYRNDNISCLLYKEKICRSANNQSKCKWTRLQILLISNKQVGTYIQWSIKIKNYVRLMMLFFFYWNILKCKHDNRFNRNHNKIEDFFLYRFGQVLMGHKTVYCIFN